MKIKFPTPLMLLALCYALSSCSPDEVPKEAISGDFGDEHISFSEPLNGTDTFSNAYYYNDISNQINLIRYTAGYKKEVAMFLHGIPLDELKVPAAYAGTLELKEPWNPITGHCQFCDIDSVNYVSTGQPFQIIITGKKGDMLTGKFFGIIQTKTGKSMTVSDGKFRIKLIRKPF